MAKVSENGVWKKLSESAQSISLNGTKFQMNEMSIGRAKNLALLLTKELDNVSSLLSQSGIETLDLSAMVIQYSEQTFTIVKRLFDFVFEYKNDDYEPPELEWLKEALSIRLMINIVKALAEQNQMAWLLPFFTSRLKNLMKTIPDDFTIPETTPEPGVN